MRGFRVTSFSVGCPGAARVLAVLGCLLILVCTGCGKKKPASEQGPSVGETYRISTGRRDGATGGPTVNLSGNVAFPWLQAGRSIDGKELSADQRKTARAPSEAFNQKYASGLQQFESGDLGKAMEIFEEIVRTFPGSDEASMAEYRIAQIHFRNRANHRALETYRRIVSQYPLSPVSENARAAITYLETFEAHEKAYISPDADDERRRNR